MKILIIVAVFSVLASPVVAVAHGGETHIEILPFSVAHEAREEISVTVMLHTVEAATSLRIHLAYDANSLQTTEVKPNTDDFPFWWRQEGKDGIVELEASVPAPGFQGEGVVATITFEATQTGFSEIMVADSSLVLTTEDRNLLAGEGRQEDTLRSAYNGITIGVGMAIVAAVAGGGGILVFLRQKNKRDVE